MSILTNLTLAIATEEAPPGGQPAPARAPAPAELALSIEALQELSLGTLTFPLLLLLLTAPISLVVGLAICNFPCLY